MILFFSAVECLQGTPRLVEFIDDCMHRIEWPTNVICEPFRAPLDEQTCQIRNGHLNKNLELTSIFDGGKFKV